MRDIFTFHSAICLLGGKEADSEECAEADEMHFNEVNFKQLELPRGIKKCNFILPSWKKLIPPRPLFGIPNTQTLSTLFITAEEELNPLAEELSVFCSLP